MIEQYAPAKLTWSLRVLGTRPDGFHEIEALVVPVSEPGDTVGLTSTDGPISLRVAGATRSVPTDATNLAWRAAAECGVRVAITLDKRIPAGSGLGGGSSDAAAVLRALRASFGVGASRVDAVAATLGSDVPVCLHARAAWMRGRGDVLEPVELGRPTHVLSAIPPLHCSTADVYGAWDELGGPSGRRPIARPPGLAPFVDHLVNDLEPAAERVEPRLASFRASLERATGRAALLAGSGSAYVTWFEDPGECAAMAGRVEDELRVTTFVGVTG